LEKIIFEEISHWFVGRDVPPSVEVKVENVEPNNQDQGTQLRLVANRYHAHQDGTNKILNNLHGTHLEPEESDEHEDQENSSSKLEIHLGLVLTEGWDSGKQRLSFHPGLSQDQQQGANQSQVTEQELDIPQNTVRHGLKNDDKEECSTSDVDLEPSEDHGDGSELSNHIDEDEHGRQEPAAPPGDVHVLPLLAPLDPHTNPILEKGGDEAESGQVRQDMLRISCHLIREILGFR